MSNEMIGRIEAARSMKIEGWCPEAARRRGVVWTIAALALALGAALVVPKANGQEQPEAAPKGRIVNVDEHLEALSEVPKLLAAMDAVGIRKTVLLGSPSFTFSLKSGEGFAGYLANNELVLAAAAKHPDRFEAWPTIDPEDPEKLDKLKAYVERGATGLKLYGGNGYRDRSSRAYIFHKIPMDDPRMAPVYQYVQEKNIPVMFHVNPGPTNPGFAEEFIAVLKQYPDMKVIAPHFILSSIKDTRLRELLDTFPNLYSDIGFGEDPYLRAGLTRISKNSQKFRQLFEKYPDRFMYGTGVVVKQSSLRTEQWLAERFRAYVDMLSKKEYQADIGRALKLQGLALPAALRDRILYENFAAFMAKRPSGTQITRQINWDRMGVQPTRRAVAQAPKTDDKEWTTLEKEALGAASPEARLKAVQNLARKDDEMRTLPILAEVLKKDPSPEVRDEALSALEFFDTVPREPVLERLTDPTPAIRLHALEIIEDEEWDGANIEKALVRAADDGDGEVRNQAVSLLGEIEAWNALEQIAKENKNEEVRRLAAEQLESR